MEKQTQTQTSSHESTSTRQKPSVLASMRPVMSVLPATLIEEPNEPVFRAVRRAQSLLEIAREQNRCFEETFNCFDHSEFDQFERRIDALLEAERAFIDAVGVERAAALDEAFVLAQGTKADLVLATRYGFRHVPALREQVGGSRGASTVPMTIRQIDELVGLIEAHRPFLTQSIVVDDEALARSREAAAALRSARERLDERAPAGLIDERNRAWTLFVWAREQFTSMWRCIRDLHPDAPR
ncbi:MAG: hypothetical protein KC609_15040 [Myxococcales bacterium]|nr:hypothetical protein [Myxococcales bacterium]